MRVAGVDGCKAGWVVWKKSRGKHSVCVVGRFADIPFKEFDAIAVDMPIGLLDAAIKGGRESEKLARSYLPKGRKSSVFSAPARAIFPFVDGEFDDAKAASKKASRGIALSIQAFNIAPKIVEIDAVLTANRRARKIVREVHPEYAFALMNNGFGLIEKKTKPEGFEKRVDLLAKTKFVARSTLMELVDSNRDSKTATDDIVDAAACCWVAEGIAQGDFHSLPAKPPLDPQKLPMAIWGRGKNPPTLALPRKGGGK